MTTPTPQDIATAERIIHHSRTPIKDIAAALAAERSRWQAECERLRGALQQMLDDLTDEDDEIHTAVKRAKAALAQPATAEREVMPNRSEQTESRRDNTPPQPAPSPAGAMEGDRLSRIRAWAIENSPANQYKWIDPKTVIELVDELTRLRSAPPVSEEMRAALQFYADPGNYRSTYSDPVTSTGAHRASKVEREQGERARAALTAALAPASGTQP